MLCFKTGGNETTVILVRREWGAPDGEATKDTGYVAACPHVQTMTAPTPLGSTVDCLPTHALSWRRLKSDKICPKCGAPDFVARVVILANWQSGVRTTTSSIAAATVATLQWLALHRCFISYLAPPQKSAVLFPQAV